MKNTNPSIRIRKAVAALALAAAAGGPVAVVTATPASASAIGSCPVWACGSNHNEEAALDEQA
jgi:hypothetical protein